MRLADEVALARVADRLVGEDPRKLRVEYGPLRPTLRELRIEERDRDLAGFPAEALLIPEVEPGRNVVALASHLHHTVF